MASNMLQSVSSIISRIPNASLSLNPFSSTSASSGPSTQLDKMFHTRIRPLLDACDRLRGLLRGESIALPSIVVVGDQSSGKSSVLEALSAVNLPRGTTHSHTLIRTQLTFSGGKIV